MSYSIHITKTAERDLVNARDYIAFVLKNPTASEHLLDVAEKEISALSVFPESGVLVDEPVLNEWGVRFVTLNNYIAFYIIEGNIVHIVRFLYGKSDWITILKTGYNIE